MDNDWIHRYYRRNNFGQPTCWYARTYGDRHILVGYGIVGKTISENIIAVNRKPIDEIGSRINAKRKAGYKLLSELKDNTTLPVEGELLSYLHAYLPTNRTDANDALLPMLAKVYTDKVFNKQPEFLGQFKINGLRCFVSAYRELSLFNDIRLKFQSREGTVWNSLDALEARLLLEIPKKFLERMVEENLILDGELYLPGYPVNAINHFVKDPTDEHNSLLQYWCYDLAVEGLIQHKRLEILGTNLGHLYSTINCLEDHMNINKPLVLVNSSLVESDSDALELRNEFINYGFEGLILRNPDAEYQYGKRNQTMLKYKSSTDGAFTIVDIYPEGVKRNVPLFLLRNDVNDATFEVHINGSMQYQETFLNEGVRIATIGKRMFVSFGERSGVNKVPFHVSKVMLIDKKV